MEQGDIERVKVTEMATPSDDARSSGSSLLPPDGTRLRVSPWRQQIAWIPTALYTFFAIGLPITAIQDGYAIAALVSLLGCGFAAIGSARLALSGVILEPRGIKVRSAWWTHHWRWDDIDHFELRERGNIPRLRIHLRNGKIKKAVGFFARSPAQEERCQALFGALEERLEAEQTEHGARGSA